MILIINGEIVYITDRSTCIYCARAYFAKYKSKYFQIGDFKKELGKDHDLNEELTLFVAWLLQQISEFVATGHDREEQMQLKWPSPERLTQLDIYEVSWTLPEDQYMSASWRLAH